MKSLGTELPKEQIRCRRLLVDYRSIGPAGEFGAMMIEAALRKADQAIISGDIVRMMRSYQELREFK